MLRAGAVAGDLGAVPAGFDLREPGIELQPEYATSAEVDYARGAHSEALVGLEQAAKEYDRAADGWSAAQMRTRRGDLLFELGQVNLAKQDWTEALTYYGCPWP